MKKKNGKRRKREYKHINAHIHIQAGHPQHSNGKGKIPEWNKIV